MYLIRIASQRKWINYWEIHDSGVAGSFLCVRPNLGEGYEGCHPLNVKAPAGSGFERD